MEKQYDAAAQIHDEFPSVSPRSKAEVLTKKPEKKFSTRKAMALGAIALALFSGADNIASESSAAQKPTTSFRMPSGENLNFYPAKEFQTENINHIQPDEKLYELINTRDKFFNEVGLDPKDIQDKKSFREWVTKEFEASTENPVSEMNVNDFVYASARITADNLKYSWDASANAKTDKQPMDRILTEHLPAECETYAATQQAVFNELKELYPDKLPNTYLVENYIQSEDVMHYVNLVVQVKSPSEADLSFSDPTALDVNGKIAHHYLKAENSDSLIRGLHARGIEIDKS